MNSYYDPDNRQTVRGVSTDYVYAIDDDVAEGLRNPPRGIYNPSAAVFADIRARAIVQAMQSVQAHFDNLKAAIKAGKPI